MKKLELKEVKALLVMVTGFSILSVFFHSSVLLYIAIGIGVVSLLIPVAGYYIVWLWNKIGMVLGWVNSRIILSALFYLFLFPIALLSRLFNKDTLRLKRQSDSHKNASLYTIRDHQYTPKDLKDMW